MTDEQYLLLVSQHALTRFALVQLQPMDDVARFNAQQDFARPGVVMGADGVVRAYSPPSWWLNGETPKPPRDRFHSSVRSGLSVAAALAWFGTILGIVIAVAGDTGALSMTFGCGIWAVVFTAALIYWQVTKP